MQETSDLTGQTWTTSALYLRAGAGCSSLLIRRNSEYHHFDPRGTAGVIKNASGTVTDNSLFDNFGVLMYETGSAQTPWRWMSRFEDVNGLVAKAGAAPLPTYRVARLTPQSRKPAVRWTARSSPPSAS